MIDYGKLTHTVTTDFFVQAIKNYVNVTRKYPEDIRKQFPEPGEWLHNRPTGLGWFHSGKDIVLSEFAYQQVQMLNGPHADTLLRAWFIKKGILK